MSNADPRVSQLIDRTLGSAQRSRGESSVSAFEELSRSVLALHGEARESFQKLAREQFGQLANKLERGQELNAMERQALELLIVGEARYYLKTENNFHNWLEELARLMTELQRARNAGPPEVHRLMHVQALCRDVRTVLPDILHYLREQERVRQFELALEGPIGEQQGKFLAGMIRDLFSSKDR
jgi:hypothetical protein